MTIPLYNLDDRRWNDLVTESETLIPLYAPEWTDFNASDPGITLVELFAWLAEMDIYQLNRITDAQRRKLLALVGLHPKPPRAARTVLAFTVAGERTVRNFPRGIEFQSNQAMNSSASNLQVRTLGALTIASGTLLAVQVSDGVRLNDVTNRWTRGTPFPVFGPDPKPGAALYLGFESSLLPCEPLSLVFTVLDPIESEQAHERLIQDAREQASYWRLSNTFSLCQPPVPQQATSTSEDEKEMAVEHPSVRLVWEYLDSSYSWSLIQEVTEDTTRSLTLNGRVVLQIPGPMGTRALGQVTASLAYLRCRFASGVYDKTPVLQNVAYNAIEAQQATFPDLNANAGDPNKAPLPSIPFQHLAPSTGQADQTRSLSERPVLVESVRVYVREEGAWNLWKLVPDFDSSGPADRHVVLEPTAGTLTFGNGARGWVAAQGAAICVSYLATRADGGNLPAGRSFTRSLRKNALPQAEGSEPFAGITVTNPIAFSGGAAAETLAHAEGRAFGLTDRTTRAVTLQDYETLARQTPGVNLARVRALANVHPHFPCIAAPGVITLIVVPFLPLGRPTASAELLRAVSAFLARRRTIGTRVEVIGPNYMVVTVTATVQISQAASNTEVPRRVLVALEQFLDPLTGGPDGNGWPFARDVVQAEILAVIAQTAGVDCVLGLSLSANGGPPQCGNLCIGFAGLVVSGKHQVTVAGSS